MMIRFVRGINGYRLSLVMPSAYEVSMNGRELLYAAVVWASVLHMKGKLISFYALPCSPFRCQYYTPSIMHNIYSLL